MLIYGIKSPVGTLTVIIVILVLLVFHKLYLVTKWLVRVVIIELMVKLKFVGD